MTLGDCQCYACYSETPGHCARVDDDDENSKKAHKTFPYRLV